jgi:hypothetical protein
VAVLRSVLSRARETETMAAKDTTVTALVAVMNGQFTSCSKGAAETTRKIKAGRAK